MEDVVEEPLHVRVLRGAEAEQLGEAVRNAGDKGVSAVSLEHEEIMVREGHLRDAFGSLGVVHSRVGEPCLAGVLEVGLHAAPFIPGQEAVETDED